MSSRLLAGKEPAAAMLREIAVHARALSPSFVILQIGKEPESNVYITKKMQAASEVGIRAEHRIFPETVAASALIAEIHRMNADDNVHGYILQLPLPPSLWTTFPQIIREMDPHKDVDGFTAYNLGKAFLSTQFEHLPPATPAGVIALLEHYAIPVAGRDAVVVGASNLVGKPLAVMLLNRAATVTVCHIQTRDLAAHTRKADLLFSAVGKPGLITADMVKDGAVVVDIGISRTEEGLKGDVDFDAVKSVASAITPVPGGVGPMTVACLLRNVLRAAERQTQ